IIVLFFSTFLYIVKFEQKTTINKLLKSERLLQNVFTSIQDGIVILDKNYNIININPEINKWYPQLNKFKNEKCYKAFHDQEEPCNNCPVQECYKTEELVYRVKPKRWNQGKPEGTLDIFAFPLYDHISGDFNGVIEYLRDSTEHYLAEKKLRESEKKFRSFIESTPVATFLYQNYKCIYANPAAINLTEYSLDELYTKKFWDFVHPDYRNTIIDIAKTSGRITPFTLVNEIKIITKSGSEKWINGNMVLIEYEEKRAALISAIDITEQKIVEEKLKESEFKYRTLFEETLTPIFIVNINGMFADANKAALEFVECTIDELRKKNVFDLSPPQFLEKQKQEHSPFYGKRTLETECYINGKIKTLLLNIVPIEIEGKKLLFGIGPDITKRKIIEMKLKDSEEKYRKSFDNAPFAIILFNIEGKILDCNKSTFKITGYYKDELIGKNLKEFEFYKVIQVAMGKQRQISVNGGNVSAVREILLNKKDKNQFWARSYIDSIQLGKDIYIQAIIQDITQQKKAREQFNKLSKLKFELLTRTSHELKTPTMHIKGYADLLLHKYKSSLNKEELNIIEHIKKGVLRLQTLIYDILHKAELDSGTCELYRIENNLSSLIELSVRELQSFATLRGHSIISTIDDNIKINFDRDQIRHVINNLLNNAIKYTPPNGVIKISSTINDDFVTIAVHDNGIGIIEKEKERLFTQLGKIERFGEGFDIITEGSGLGLYIAKNIIELHGGEIWAESMGRNKGSTFYFTLPNI
ncbi:MAG: PAS domain S-box protein, partial [Promethearchaeota archaeon]